MELFGLNNHHFRSINPHLVNFNRSFNQKYIEKIKNNRIEIEIAIVDSIKIVEIRIDVNRRSNLKPKFDSTTTIRSAIPNRISLGDCD